MLSKRLAAVTLLLAWPSAVRAQEGPVTDYPAAFFAPAQPYSAFDMLLRLPGFTFDPGDAEVRGFGGASGNVLIDGKRPTSKQESLEAVLRRIPAKAVERVQLIRAGARGVDMQGRALVANVVRRAEATTRARFEAGLSQYPGHRQAPRLAAEATRRSGDRLIEASASVERQVDTEKGSGPRNRLDPTGATVRVANYRENQWTDLAQAVLGYEDRVFGGKLRLDASAQDERTRANIVEAATFPEVSTELVREQEHVAREELGGHFERRLGGGWTLEALALGRWSRTRGRDQSDEGAEREVASVALDERETIGRALMRRERAATTLELGAEAAVNTLSSHNGLVQDGVVERVEELERRLEERRAEGFGEVM